MCFQLPKKFSLPSFAPFHHFLNTTLSVYIAKHIFFAGYIFHEWVSKTWFTDVNFAIIDLCHTLCNETKTKHVLKL